ncbi:MAG TPA: PAS domain-containing protein [Rhizomicrobium sp.]|nr:PAS domain-containing protein [Rhizomicrobium sp.]
MLAETTAAVDDFNARSARGQWHTQCYDKLIFDSPKLAQLRDIWLAVRGDKALPRREDFTARILGRHLQGITFVERVEEGGTRRYRFRMFGSGLARFIGDCTGKFLDEVVPPVFIDSWLATYDLGIDARNPLRFVSRFRAAELEHVQAECLVAPVTGGGGKPWGLLVSVVYSPVVV